MPCATRRWRCRGAYTLTRRPGHRVQLDLLAGFTLEHSAHRQAGSALDSVQQGSGVVTSDFDERAAYNNLLLSAGPGGRCRLGTHFELLYDLLYNVNIRSDRVYQIQGLTPSSALGLRCRFGHQAALPLLKKASPIGEAFLMPISGLRQVKFFFLLEKTVFHFGKNNALSTFSSTRYVN